MSKQICEAKDCEQECHGYLDLLCPFHQKRQYIIETKELCKEITRLEAENERLRELVPEAYEEARRVGHHSWEHSNAKKRLEQSE